MLLPCNLLKLSTERFGSFVSEAGVQNPNPRKRRKQTLKMGHGGTLDSAASGVLGKRNVTLTSWAGRCVLVGSKLSST